MEQTYKRTKKSTVQLTSLLDLLFVMIFVSLIQQKNTPQTPPIAEKAKPIVKEKIVTVEKAEKIEKEVKPQPTQFSLQATFSFYGTAQNPHLPQGSYVMHGVYNQKNGELHLGGVSWINRPAHYDMVPLSGVIGSNQKVFEGRIEFPGCQKFTLTRKTETSNNPIAGQWEGVYDCSQGKTGLTLTIH